MRSTSRNMAAVRFKVGHTLRPDGDSGVAGSPGKTGSISHPTPGTILSNIPYDIDCLSPGYFRVGRLYYIFNGVP